MQSLTNYPVRDPHPEFSHQKPMYLAHLHDDLAELLAAGLDVEEDPLVAGHGGGG